MGQSIGILSIKGGVGKTTTVAALGAALAQQGKKVLVIDANFSAPNLALHLGIVQPNFSIDDVIRKKVHVNNSIIETEHGFDLIAGKLANRLALKKRPDYLKLKENIQDLKDYYDVVLIDSSPNLNDETLAAMIASDKLLVVTTPDHATLSCTLHAVKIAKRKKTPIIGLVLNKVYKKNFELGLDEIEESTDVPILAVIPHELTIPKSLAEFKPVTATTKETDATAEYKALAAVLIGENYQDKRLKTRLRRFFSFNTPKSEINRQENMNPN